MIRKFQHLPRYCACGCGTQISFTIHHGKLVRFLYAHRPQLQSNPPRPRQCKCGCGALAPIVRRRNLSTGKSDGWDRLQFIPGHYGDIHKRWAFIFQGMIFQPSFYCPDCGILIELLDAFRRKRCPDCQKKFDNRRRNTRKHDRYGHGIRHRCRILGLHYEPFSLLGILERDHWACQICGKLTPKEKRGTIEWDAPEIDHIWPLGAEIKGPGHVPSNVRCACRKCNLEHSNKIDLETSMNHFKDEENRSALAAEVLQNGRQKAEDTADQRLSQAAEKSHGQRSSHAKQLENRPCNTHSFDFDGM